MTEPINLTDVLATLERMAANVMFDSVRQDRLLEAARLLRADAAMIAELRAAIETMRKYAQESLENLLAGRAYATRDRLSAMAGWLSDVPEIAAALALRKESEAKP